MTGWSRRELLRAAAQLAAWAALPAAASPPAAPPTELLPPDALDTLLHTLLPSSPGSPGARDVNAAGFLRRLGDPELLGPRFDERLAGGLRALDQLATQRSGVPFARADYAARIAVLEEYAAAPEGAAWLEPLLVTTLEAFFSAPRWGGNPGGIAWAWAGARPPPTAP